MWLRRRRRPGAASDDELQAEIRAHLEQRADELVHSGLPPDEALRRARVEFGSIEAWREAARAERPGATLRDVSGQIWRELVQGWRRLRRTPAFTIFAVVSLALGIGATTAVYSMVAAVLQPATGVPHPDRLVVMTKPSDSGPWWYMLVSKPDFDALQRALGGRPALAAEAPIQVALVGESAGTVLNGEAVTGDYFSTVGVRMALGRPVGPDDDKPGAPGVVVLSHRVWRATFGGDPSVIGRTVRIGGEPFTVIGVAPASFRGIEFALESQPDGWIPWNAALRVTSYLRTHIADAEYTPLTVVGRAESSAGATELVARIASVGAALDGTAPVRAENRSGVARPREWMPMTLDDAIAAERTSARRLDVVFVSLIALVVVVACTNLANMMLGRGAAREHEIAVRRALGASKVRLIREQVAESAIVAAGGTLGAMLVARLLLVVGPVDFHDGVGRIVHIDPRLDVPVLVFSAISLLLSLIVFGLLPAIELTRSALRARLSRGETAGAVACAGGVAADSSRRKSRSPRRSCSSLRSACVSFQPMSCTTRASICRTWRSAWWTWDCSRPPMPKAKTEPAPPRRRPVPPSRMDDRRTIARTRNPARRPAQPSMTTP